MNTSLHAVEDAGFRWSKTTVSDLFAAASKNVEKELNRSARWRRIRSATCRLRPRDGGFIPDTTLGNPGYQVAPGGVSVGPYPSRITRRPEAGPSGRNGSYPWNEAHSAFFGSCGNRRLLAVWEQHVPTFAELFRLTTALDEPLSRSVEWHQQMLDIVYAGDPDSIAAEVHKLVVGGEEQIIAAQRQLLEQRNT